MEEIAADVRLPSDFPGFFNDPAARQKLRRRLRDAAALDQVVDEDHRRPQRRGDSQNRVEAKSENREDRRARDALERVARAKHPDEQDLSDQKRCVGGRSRAHGQHHRARFA